MMKQSIIESDVIPELDEKINGIKTEIGEKLRKIMEILEKEDFKKKYKSNLMEGFQYETLYAQFDNLTKELRDFVEQEREMDVALFNRMVEQTKQSLKNQADSNAAKWTTITVTVQEKLNDLVFQKKAADATIAKQSEQISKLTGKLTHARNLKLELQKWNEKYQKRRRKLLDQLQNPEAIMERNRDILKLEEAQAKMASQVGEKIDQTLKGMGTLSVKFEEEFGYLGSRIYEIKNEVKDVMKWISDNKTKHGQLKQEIGRLVEELKEEKDKMEEVQRSGENEMRRLNQSVKRGEEKIDELEKIIAEKDEKMREMETKITAKESTIWSLSKTLESVISTATTKISKA